MCVRQRGAAICWRGARLPSAPRRRVAGVCGRLRGRAVSLTPLSDALCMTADLPFFVRQTCIVA